ncbi:MAG TPA: APC family permease [Solirubrobacteraceae bacterium]|jgi:amino acid transporter|nr:APC family permease [Solirubrobacteraceae bacterium]
MADLQQEGTDAPSRQSSQLFVRRSTGLVREASALDATIFNAVFSAPVGATLAWGVFFALTAFPGADLVAAVLWSFVLNIPILIMMSLLASSMPKTGGDYVWVSRILSPPAALVSNFGAAFSAIIGATFWARYFPVFGLGPVLVTLGTIFNSHGLITAGQHIEADKGWIFLGGFVMILWMTAILIAGTKTTFRWQNVFWFIASAGTLIAFVVLLFASKSGFEHHFNTISHTFGVKGNAYQKVITDAHAQNIHPHAFGGATTPAIFVIMTFMIWNWWSVYLSGELKSASNRNRQMSIMFGALSWNVVGLVVGVLLLYKVTGYQFIVGANTAGNVAYALPTGPFYHFFAGLAVSSNVLTTIIVASFLFWSLPAMVGNTFMPIRSVFAWSFDRVLPERFSNVNERFHSPVPAILLVMALVTAMLAWSVTATTFQTLLALGVLAGVVCVVIVGVAAFAFPIRRPDVYNSSPANIKFMGIHVLQIVAPLSIAVVAFLTWEAWHYPALALSGNTGNRWQIPAFMAGIVVVGLLIYYIAKAVRRSQGIDLDLVYKELPPD